MSEAVVGRAEFVELERVVAELAAHEVGQLVEQHVLGGPRDCVEPARVAAPGVVWHQLGGVVTTLLLRAASPGHGQTTSQVDIKIVELPPYTLL